MAGQGTRALRALAGIAVAIVVVVGIDAAGDLARGFDGVRTALRIADAQMAADPGEQAGFHADNREDATARAEGGTLGGARLDDLLSSEASPGCAPESLKGELTGEGAVPAWFSRELWVPDGARDVRVSATEDVAGFTVPSSSSGSVFEDIRAALEERGWTASPTGVAGCAVFGKKEGECRWALATCIQVGDATSVVIRCLTE